MEVILREDILNLGRMGELVRVKNGYARNYLLPRGLVMVANKKNLNVLEHQKRVISRVICTRESTSSGRHKPSVKNWLRSL